MPDVLTLDLPDSDGEPMENEREYFQVVLLYEALEQYWHDRQDFYMGGNMFVYYSPEQAHEILAEEAEPVHSCRAFRGLDLFVVLYVVGVIPVTHPSFRAGTSTLTTGIIPKTSTHNNRYASYLFTLPAGTRGRYDWTSRLVSGRLHCSRHYRGDYGSHRPSPGAPHPPLDTHG